MITITKLTDQLVIEEFFKDRTILYNHGSDFKVLFPEFFYLGIYEDSKLIGIDICKTLTNKMVEMHLYLLPTIRYSRIKNGQTVNNISDSIKDYIKMNTNYSILQAHCPIECEHVIKYLKRTGFKPMAYVPNATIYHGKLQGLLYYIYDLTEAQ